MGCEDGLYTSRALQGCVRKLDGAAGAGAGCVCRRVTGSSPMDGTIHEVPRALPGAGPTPGTRCTFWGATHGG